MALGFGSGFKAKLEAEVAHNFIFSNYQPISTLHSPHLLWSHRTLHVGIHAFRSASKTACKDQKDSVIQLPRR